VAVSVCIPARNEAATIGPIVEGSLSVADQVVVVDASTDETARIAAELGAEVHAQSELLPELGPVLGKGDAMYRSLTVLTGEIVCFVDADSEDFGPHFVTRLAGAVEAGHDYVKGFYRRPFKVGETTLPEGGGRVTELTARPLLRLFFPELAQIRQPLAGEIAARRELLERIPWVTGYGIEIAQLIDVYREVGIEGIGQVDLDVRQNRHQPLSSLGPMADAVLAAVMNRVHGEPEVVERPPLASHRWHRFTPRADRSTLPS
jgi:glucosyl-3-phosphoglycerate synthase